MSYESAFNAKRSSPREIARSFIPPGSHFQKIASNDHTLILGPRGSGKTTLLKMLTIQALNSWKHPQADELIERVQFNAVFVPADLAWGEQLEALSAFDFHPGRKEAAFVIHTLRALIFSMREAVELGRGEIRSSLNHLVVNLSAKKEEELTCLLASALDVTPLVNSLLGLELSLQSELNRVSSADDLDRFSVESLSSQISSVVSAFNGQTGDNHRRWALMFDEIEIAPKRIKDFLLYSQRGFDERIIIKLAIAPYMDDFKILNDGNSPNSIHDYKTVQLTYPNKEDALSFTIELFKSILNSANILTDNIATMIDRPTDTRGLGRSFSKPIKRDSIPEEFVSLFKKDNSFKLYIDSRKMFSTSYVFNEQNVARDFRKVLPIVTAREFYIRRHDTGSRSLSRSRKSYELYAGFPSLFEMTEGNPRAILAMSSSIVDDVMVKVRARKPPSKISTPIQVKSISLVETLLTTLMQAIGIEVSAGKAGKGLLDFMDEIGDAFQDRLLRQDFTADYVGTFLLDADVSEGAVAAVGKALNAGAIIHVPLPDSGPDSLLLGPRGQRFRVSYALAARYKLLLTLGNYINLSTLLAGRRDVDVRRVQPSLFDKGPPNVQ
jgi:energy-coupling factor transporter ATP-binding protein EcfA2